MSRPHPPEFRRRAVELARERAKPIAEIARDLEISESCLRHWMDVADVDEGRKEGLTTDERKELVELRRKLRVAEMEVEILNSLVESFFGTLQLELLDQRHWRTRDELARAIFEDRSLVQPRRRHTSIGSLSPIDYEARATPAATAA